MIPAGELGDDTAVLGMDLDLRVQCVCQQTPLSIIKRHSGLIAAGFDPQNSHYLIITPPRSHSHFGDRAWRLTRDFRLTQPDSP